MWRQNAEVVRALLPFLLVSAAAGDPLTPVERAPGISTHGSGSRRARVDVIPRTETRIPPATR